MPREMELDRQDREPARGVVLAAANRLIWAKRLVREIMVESTEWLRGGLRSGKIPGRGIRWGAGLTGRGRW